MGKNFRETLNEQLQDPKFKAEWDALDRKGLEAVETMRKIAAANGIADMTLDEINAEISEVRKSSDTATMYNK